MLQRKTKAKKVDRKNEEGMGEGVGEGGALSPRAARARLLHQVMGEQRPEGSDPAALLGRNSALRTDTGFIYCLKK